MVNSIVEIVGKDRFEWLAKEFKKETRLRDLPDEILDPIGFVDITIRDYGRDRNAIIAIAFLTFAYKMAAKAQQPQYGPNDVLLLKVLAKSERSRRNGKTLSDNKLWEAPLYELITGEVGERIRQLKFMPNPT